MEESAILTNNRLSDKIHKNYDNNKEKNNKLVEKKEFV